MARKPLKLPAAGWKNLKGKTMSDVEYIIKNIKNYMTNAEDEVDFLDDLIERLAELRRDRAGG